MPSFFKVRSALLGSFFILAACSHEKSHLRTEVYPAAVDPEYLAEKESEISRLQARLQEMKSLARDETRKYQGSHRSFLELVDRESAQLDQAKEELRILKEAEGKYLNDLSAKLNQRLDDMRSTLNTAVAE